jgi:hypothetical protein
LYTLQAALVAGLCPNLAFIQPSPKTEETAKQAIRSPKSVSSGTVEKALNARTLRWISPQDGAVLPHPSSLLAQALPQHR